MSLDVKAWTILLAVAALGVTTSRAADLCPEYLRFLESKCSQWQSNILPKSIPAARGNAFADNEAAAAFGMKVFYDNRFAKSGSGVACVSCHDPEHAFAEQKATSHTILEVARNAPDLINAAWYTGSHFWDGKVDTLWSAPLFTFEQDAEMGSSRLTVAHTTASIYKIRYEKIFGPLPDLSDTKRFPPSGKPGTPEFDGMEMADQNLVNQVYVNVGKALEAYIRKLAAGRSPFDDFMNGSAKSLSAAAQCGMVAFNRNGCDRCHSGPTFTDQGFHSLDFRGQSGKARDPARAGGMALASKWQFGSTSKFADPGAGTQGQVPAEAPGEPDGFRTPTLRNVDLTGPYGHNGAFTTLEQVIDAHAQILPRGKAPDSQDEHDIIEFLRALSGRPPSPPWNYWPGG